MLVGLVLKVVVSLPPRRAFCTLLRPAPVIRASIARIVLIYLVCFGETAVDTLDVDANTVIIKRSKKY